MIYYSEGVTTMGKESEVKTVDQVVQMPVSQSLQIGRRACDKVAPMWGLDGFVAVNPFWGFKQDHLLDAARSVRAYAHAGLFGGQRYFGGMYQDGTLTDADLSRGIRACVWKSRRPTETAHKTLLQSVQHWLRSGEGAQGVPTLLSVPEAIDLLVGSTWNDIITNEISKFCALYFDRGQAAWTAPLKDHSLYEAWKTFASIDRTLGFKGLKNATTFFEELSNSYEDVLSEYGGAVKLMAPQLQHLLTREIFAIKGWAAYAQHIAFESNKVGKQSTVVLELLAVRLAYALLILSKYPSSACLDLVSERISALTCMDSEEEDPLLMDYICQEALESRFMTQLLNGATGRSSKREALRAKVQAVFCIDVRSEGFRRAFEAQSDEIETYGFAGFFGLSFKYRACNASCETGQYPVLLGPKFMVTEQPDADRKFLSDLGRHRSALVRTMRQSISAGFSYVEAFGIPYVVSMVKDALLLGSKRVGTGERKLLELDIELSTEEKTEAAKAMLVNMGLRPPYAPVILLCGHKGVTANNPYAASLDCGACGGHSGEINARVAAAILNDPAVRAQLNGTILEPPDDTIFVAAVHNTTTDNIELLIDERTPGLSRKLSIIEQWLMQAGDQARRFRLPALGKASADGRLESNDDVFRIVSSRSADWSEVRPEWSLARNGAFIAARRELTKGMDLGNRVFLHEYDHNRDTDLSLLELILTAPVVVASWINLQYYGSSIAPGVFGSGNKVIHNVVGHLGVILGNGGDLQIGLPFQSVHTGRELFHEPLRLHVLVEAPPEKIEAIIERHELLQQLVFNGWIKLFSVGGAMDDVRQLVRRSEWEVVESEAIRKNAS